MRHISGSAAKVLLPLLVVATSLPIALDTTRDVEAIVVMAESGTVSGSVWNDTNGNGFKDETEPGVSGVGVKAYDALGALVGTATSGNDGTYSLTVTNAETADVRIEFETPLGYRPAPSFNGSANNTNGTSIQFATVDETDVDYGILIPENFCGDNQSDSTLSGTVVATCFYPGARNWEPTSDRGTVKFTPWNSRNDNVGAENTLAKNVATGALWGLGYQRSTGLLFASAVVRRHADLGPQGIGGLYAMRNGEVGVVDSWDLAALYADDGVLFSAPGSDWSRAGRGIASVDGDTTSTAIEKGMSKDIIGWDNVGKAGIGDIDVSPDGQYLWVVNLYERTLLRIALTGTRAAPALGTLTEFAIPTDVCSNSGSEERPWAVDPRPDGTVRVGLVCDNAGAQDTAAKFNLDNKSEGAFVYELSTSGSWSQLLSIPLATRLRFDEACGRTEDDDGNSIGNPNPIDGACWQSWLGNWDSYITGSFPRGLLGLLPQKLDGGATFQYGQPMLMDIENLRDGSLVLGFSDRTSMQMGSDNIQPTSGPDLPTENVGKDGYDSNWIYMTGWVMGEMILACKTATSWNIESGGNCSGVNSYSGVQAESDPSPGEFFQDFFEAPHYEVRSGGLATMPGAVGEEFIGAASMDPCTIFSGGVYWNKTSNGIKPEEDPCATYTGLGNEGSSPLGFGKSTSMGDLETICDSAPIEIGNRIWNDLNKNGIQDPGEPPIAGVTVRLYASDGITLIGTAVTDERGEYYFNSLLNEDDDEGDNLGVGPDPFEDYILKIDNPNDYAAGGPLSGATLTLSNQTALNGAQSDAVNSDYTQASPTDYPTFAVDARLPGESDHTFDAGFNVPLFAVGDYTWLDANRDGIQDANELPLAGVGVELWNGDGKVASTVTDENGFYLFDGLPAGEYWIEFYPPDGYLFTQKDAGSDDAKDSDVEDFGNFGSTDNFFLGEDEPGMVANTDPDVNAAFVNPTIDAGFVTPTLFAVGNYTWLDANRDGIQDANELPLAGVKVDLYTADGELVASTETDENGFYLFDGLPAGEYFIEFLPPDGYLFTQDNAGSDDAKDSDAIDFGNFGSTDNFFLGEDEPGMVANTDPEVNAAFVNPTIDAGFVTPTVGVGNYTWVDADRDGVQDEDELPLAGVKVELCDSAGNPVTDAFGDPVDPVFTDDEGFYFFDNLLPGTYKVRFTLPGGYAFTSPTSSGSTSANDSNPTQSVGDPLVGVTPLFTLTADTAGNMEEDSDDAFGATYFDPTIDAGVVPTVGVGDYTWVDADRDGVQDEDELPLAGVKVELCDSAGNPVTDAFGDPVDPVFTDDEGFYFFDNLLPGTYKVRFTLPGGYAFTSPTSSGSTSANDSNPTPTEDNFRVGVTALFTLTADTADDMELDVADNYGANFINPTIDAGVVRLTFGFNIDPRWFQRTLPKTGLEDGLKPLTGVYALLLGVILVTLARRRQSVLRRIAEEKRRK